MPAVRLRRMAEAVTPRNEKAAKLEAIMILASNFETELSEARQRNYLDVLTDCTVAEVQHAVHAARKLDTPWMPKPGQLRAMARRDRPAEDRASFAFAEARNAVVTFGAYRAPTFVDPLITATIRRLWGWETFCRMDSSWLGDWGRKAFCTEYKSLLEYGLAPGEDNPQLTGIHGQAALARPSVLELESPEAADARRTCEATLARLEVRSDFR